MSTLGIIGEEMEQQAALASAARKNIDDAEKGERGRQVLPRAVLDMLRPYAVALYIADRVVQSATYNPELGQLLHAKLLPFEQMVERTLVTARERGYFVRSCARRWRSMGGAKPFRWSRSREG